MGTSLFGFGGRLRLFTALLRAADWCCCRATDPSELRTYNWLLWSESRWRNATNDPAVLVATT